MFYTIPSRLSVTAGCILLLVGLMVSCSSPSPKEEQTAVSFHHENILDEVKSISSKCWLSGFMEFDQREYLTSVKFVIWENSDNTLLVSFSEKPPLDWTVQLKKSYTEHFEYSTNVQDESHIAYTIAFGDSTNEDVLEQLKLFLETTEQITAHINEVEML